MFRMLSVLVLSFLIAGCGWRLKQVPQVVPEDTDTRLGEKTDIDLAVWLGKSRIELAKLCDEWTETVTKQQGSIRRNPDSVIWLRDLHAPLLTPIFRKATYSSRAGLSLPPYLEAGKSDDAVALHLARHGDHAAALNLASPNVKGQIEAHKGQKQYPLEWTRLVALVQISAAYRLACGDPEGATQLVLVHQQLGKMLDKQAAASPLGQALLPRGRKPLAAVVDVLRDPKVNKPALADDIERSLKDWGSVPAPEGGVRPGDTAKKLAGVFGTATAKGKAWVALKQNDRRRAVDLLDWPLPDEGLESVFAFLDANDRVAMIQFAYRPKMESVYPFADHLAYHLDEAGLPGKDSVNSASVLSKTFIGAGVRCQAIRVLRGNTLGALVRLTSARESLEGARSRDPRDLRAIHFDRTFSNAGLHLAVKPVGSLLTVSDQKQLKALGDSFGLPVPGGVTVQREKREDVIDQVRVRWSSGQLNDDFGSLLNPMWTAFGPGAFAGQEASGGGHLSLTWETRDTRMQLRLPFDDRGADLIISDTTPSSKIKTRARAALARDEEDRQARLKAGKPWQWVQRSPERINSISLAGIKLGQTRSQTLAAVPSSSEIRRTTFPGGISLLLTSAASTGWRFWGRQVVLGFTDDRLSEIRIRYHELPSGEQSKYPTLLRHLESGQKRAADDVRADWIGLWADLPAPGEVVKKQWQDDLTTMTYQRDAGGSEVIWRDRAAKTATLGWCGRGVGTYVLGAKRESLGRPAMKSNGADVFAQPKSSPYESVMIWYAGDRVSRVVAVHRPGKGKDGPGQLQEAWGREIDTLGHVRRQEGKSGAAQLTYFWHDDLTRVKMFLSGQGTQSRVMTEWRPWPILVEAPKVAKK